MENKEYYVEDFKQWAFQSYLAFQEKYKKNVDRFMFERKGNKVILVDTLKDKMSVAKCRPDESFIYETGLGVAYAKLTGQAIPKELKTVYIQDLKYGQRFRLKPKNGGIYRQEFSFIGMSTDEPTKVVCEEHHKSCSTLCYIHKDWNVVVID